MKKLINKSASSQPSLLSFYRMENTQICEQIIKDFNGKKIPGEMLLHAVHAVYFLFISHHYSLQHTVSSKP